MTSSRRLSRNPRDAVAQGQNVHQTSWDNYGLTNVLYSRPVRHAFSLSKLASSLGVRRVEPPPLSSAKVGDALSSLRGVTRQDLEQTLSLPPSWSHKTGAGTNSLSLLSLAEWRSGFKLYGPAGCNGSLRVDSRSTMQGPQD